MTALRELLAGIVDYAGLFPPAGLDMRSAVTNYASYLGGQYRWMLGRFVVPARRLAELEEAIASTGVQWTGTWHLSVLVDAPADLPAVREFNARRAAIRPLLLADAVEAKATSTNDVDAYGRSAHDGLTIYLELAPGAELPALLEHVRHAGLNAKIRTGGVTEGAFPSTHAVADFINACATAAVNFKATAGLHHPVRARYPLTYEAGCDHGTMHGFLNLLVATALIRRGKTSEAHMALENEDAGSYMTDDRFSWRDVSLDIHDAATTRRFLHSFGSCSFDEPVNELKRLGLLR